MFLNLSNHPSTFWSQKQIKDARVYGEIVDLLFPEIDPLASCKMIEEVAQEYCNKIIAMSPKAAHVMGEMTFTFALINKLKSKNILCVASTSKRLVNQTEGKKVVAFEFVQFRPYYDE